MITFHHLTVVQLKEALRLREQIEVLQAELQTVLDGADTDTPDEDKRPRGKRRQQSSARTRVTVDRRNHRSKINVKSSPADGSKKKRNLSAAGRAKLSAAMKARWAARKKAMAGT